MGQRPPGGGGGYSGAPGFASRAAEGGGRGGGSRPSRGRLVPRCPAAGRGRLCRAALGGAAAGRCGAGAGRGVAGPGSALSPGAPVRRVCRCRAGRGEGRQVFAGRCGVLPHRPRNGQPRARPARPAGRPGGAATWRLGSGPGRRPRDGRPRPVSPFRPRPGLAPLRRRRPRSLPRARPGRRSRPGKQRGGPGVLGGTAVAARPAAPAPC